MAGDDTQKYNKDNGIKYQEKDHINVKIQAFGYSLLLFPVKHKIISSSPTSKRPIKYNDNVTILMSFIFG